MSHKADFFCQCKLVRGTTTQVTWIPDSFAKIGKYLKIHGEDGWQVSSVYDRVARHELRERDYLHQREASDI